MKSFFVVSVLAVIVSTGVTLWVWRTSAENPVAAEHIQHSEAYCGNTWHALRTMALSVEPESMGIKAGSSDCYGFVMELGGSDHDAPMTIVAFRDGTVSLYLGSGGGVLGLGQQSPTVRACGQQMVTASKNFLEHLDMTPESPVTAKEHVRFFVLTGRGVYSAEVDQFAVENERHALHPLYLGGRKILSAIRMSQESTTLPG